MGEPYVSEIRMFAGNFPPNGWMFCEGQLLPISENETLFQLIGTTYGGDGQSTFALPDLRGRAAQPTRAVPTGRAQSSATSAALPRWRVWKWGPREPGGRGSAPPASRSPKSR